MLILLVLCLLAAVLEDFGVVNSLESLSLLVLYVAAALLPVSLAVTFKSADL